MSERGKHFELQGKEIEEFVINSKDKNSGSSLTLLR